jgi:hypothetical protein
MDFKEIKINGEESYFKTKIENINFEQLIKDIQLNCEINKSTGRGEAAAHIKAERTIGTQSQIIIQTVTLLDVHDKIINKIFDLLNYSGENMYPYYSVNWAYISDKFQKVTHYHHHIESDRSVNVKMDWTFVYYVQMPNNLKNNEGKLFFKTENGFETSILPEVGDLLFFSSKLLHKPEIALNSELERIVYAGNFVKLDYKTDYLKKKKTIV